MKIITAHFVLALSVLMTFATYLAYANDPPALQDFCPASNDTKKMVYVDGKFCKDPDTVTSEDFVCKGSDFSSPAQGFNATVYNIDSCPGLNTMGLSAAHFTFAPGSGVPVHIHPRSSELLICKKGKIYVAFMASIANGHKIYSRVLRNGDAMVVPQAMPHVVVNMWKEPAETAMSFSSQNPGVIFLESAAFKSKPLVNLESLAKEFSLDKEVVEVMRKRFAAVETKA